MHYSHLLIFHIVDENFKLFNWSTSDLNIWVAKEIIWLIFVLKTLNVCNLYHHFTLSQLIFKISIHTRSPPTLEPMRAILIFGQGTLILQSGAESANAHTTIKAEQNLSQGIPDFFLLTRIQVKSDFLGNSCPLSLEPMRATRIFGQGHPYPT